MKIGLQGGLCSARWSCKNVNKKGCNTKPKKGYVECDN